VLCAFFLFAQSIFRGDAGLQFLNVNFVFEHKFFPCVFHCLVKALGQVVPRRAMVLTPCAVISVLCVSSYTSESDIGRCQ
jgi:hypothetical protein